MEEYPFARNIKAIRLDAGMTQVRFAESLGVVERTVIQWEKHRVRVPHEPGIIQRIKDIYHVTDSDLFGDADGYYCRTTGIGRTPAASDTFAPVLGNVAAGDPREAITQAGETRWVRPDLLERYPDCFYLRVAGDSMDRVLPEGCYALIAPGEVVSGDVAAVKVNGEDACIKRVVISEELHAVRLVPESTNPKWRTRLIDRDDPDAPGLRILGKVVWYSGDL